MDVMMPLAILAGAVAGAGVLLLVVALRGVERRRPVPRRREPGALGRLLARRGATAVLAFAITLIVTRWPVAAAGVAALVVGWRGLAGGAAEERLAMARLEGLAAWTESLRDTIAGAAGLEQAIPASLRAAAPSLQVPLRTLIDRLHTRVPLPDALRGFADDLDDPSADLVVAALILNARLRGPGLRDVLGALSSSVREELDMRRRVEAGRRSTRRSVQIVVGVSVGAAGLLTLFNRSYVAEYDGFFGQLVLSVVVGLFAAGFLWLRKLARFEGPLRFLIRAEDPVPVGRPPATVARGNGS
ncbi:MAG: type II secretion system protein [Streptosporangiales bacterium]|nr:type II secretion system protein [Streptosporangiales bacterium]